MIDYEFGEWGIGFIFRRSGVFRKAVILALPPGFLTSVLTQLEYSRRTMVFSDDFKDNGLISLWSGCTFVVTFLLVFRTQFAYSRYWDGIGALQNVFGVWFNATSNCIAMVTNDEARHSEVIAFQHLLSRLMSLLFCTALQEIAVMQDENFAILGIEGMDKDSVQHLAASPDRMEVVMQWVQRCLVDHQRNGILNIAAPILSRVFQELSNGVVMVHDAIKISEFPFPFPFAQALTVMLLSYTFFLPFVCALLVNSAWISGPLTFSITFAFWAINYIAAEIEMPFGDDPNDLPVHELNDLFNRKLVTLMDPLTQRCPGFKYDGKRHDILIPRPYDLDNYMLSHSSSAESWPEKSIKVHISRPCKSQHWKERNAARWKRITRVNIPRPSDVGQNPSTSSSRGSKFAGSMPSENLRHSELSIVNGWSIDGEDEEDVPVLPDGGIANKPVTPQIPSAAQCFHHLGPPLVDLPAGEQSDLGAGDCCKAFENKSADEATEDAREMHGSVHVTPRTEMVAKSGIKQTSIFTTLQHHRDGVAPSL